MLWAVDAAAASARAFQPGCDSILPPDVGPVGNWAERVSDGQVVMWTENCRGEGRLLKNVDHLGGDMLRQTVAVGLRRGRKGGSNEV